MKKTKYILFLILSVVFLFTLSCCEEKNENKPDDGPEPVEECDHVFEKVKGKAATCTENGYNGYYVCEICGYKEDYKEIEKLDHDLHLVKGKDPTLEEAGYTDYYECKRCGYIEGKEMIEKLDHLHSGSVLRVIERTKEACEQRICLCDYCNTEYTEYGNALNKKEEKMQDLKILLIGNSFTNYNCLIDLLSCILDGEGINAKISKFAYGGQYFHNYIEGNNGTYYETFKKAMKDAKYDIVFLQEQSNNPITDTADFFYSTNILYNYFKDLGSTVIMYETWSYRNGYQNMNYYEMHQKLSASYEWIATDLGIQVSRAGTAFYYMYRDHKSIDLNKASDGSHPNSIGTYLVALVHYATIYGRSPVGINYTYNDYIKNPNITWHGDDTRSEISAELQAELERIAYDAAWGGSNVEQKYLDALNCYSYYK